MSQPDDGLAGADSASTQSTDSTETAHVGARRLGTAIFAWEWARAVIGTNWVAADRTVVAEMLRRLAERAVDVLTADPFVPADGYEIGDGLVAAGYAAPEALGCSLDLLSGRLAADAGLDPADPAIRCRLAALVGAVAVGFSRASRDRTLAEQDAIRSSLLVARQRAERALRDSVARDCLDGVTKLLTREELAGQARKLLDQAASDRAVSSYVFELRGLQTVTHRVGAAAADRIRETAADTLAALCGEDALVARIAEDEFAVIRIVEPSLADPPQRFATEVLTALDVPVTPLNGRPLAMRALAGLATTPVAAADVAGLIRDASIALSWARADDSRVAAYDVDRARAYADVAILMAELPDALAKGELVPYYQPIVRLDDRAIVGMEALARWRHPERGLLLPASFLSAAERNGLLPGLGRRLRDEACAEAARWGGSLFVSVNLAPSELRAPGLVASVAEALERTGLVPELLHLEITENAAVDDGDLPILDELAKLGAQITLDDFGTGQSRLTELPALPVAGLKLAADLLNAVREPAFDRAQNGVDILDLVTEMAERRGLSTTAEGIETDAEADLVRRLGVQRGQGWLFGRPVPAAELGRYLS